MLRFPPKEEKEKYKAMKKVQAEKKAAAAKAAAEAEAAKKILLKQQRKKPRKIRKPCADFIPVPVCTGTGIF